MGQARDRRKFQVREEHIQNTHGRRSLSSTDLKKCKCVCVWQYLEVRSSRGIQATRMHRPSQQGKKKTGKPGDMTVKEAKGKYVLSEVISQNSEFPVPRSVSEFNTWILVGDFSSL